MFSDIIACLIGIIKSWAQVYEILEEEKSIVFNDESEEEYVLNIKNLKEVTQSELHKVSSQPKLLPYTNMIHLDLEHVVIPTKTIYNHQRTIFGSFRLENIQVMYKLSSNPKYVYNVEFVKKFEKEECVDYDRSVHDIVKTWWGNENKFKADNHGVYYITSCDENIMYIGMMLCTLYGIKTMHISQWIGSLLFMKLQMVSLLIWESFFLITWSNK
jgi:hypothetical protein